MFMDGGRKVKNCGEELEQTGTPHRAKDRIRDPSAVTRQCYLLHHTVFILFHLTAIACPPIIRFLGKNVYLILHKIQIMAFDFNCRFYSMGMFILGPQKVTCA